MGSTPREIRLRAGDGFVLRTPALPMTSLVAWAGDSDTARRYLQALVDRPEIREALFVASPSLYEAIDTWRAAPTSPAGQRVESSLVKYVARMMGRATPFGLFSAVSTGRLGRATSITLAPRSEYRRRTRLDNDYLFVLIDELLKLPELRARLRFRPNTSIYRSAGRIRYAGAELERGIRMYKLISAEVTPYLEATLARAVGGALIADLAGPLVDHEVGADEARGYVEELIAAQILVPDLGVHVTGPEPIDGLLAQLVAAGIEQPRAVLDGVRAQIVALDSRGLGNSADQYRAIATTLATLPAAVNMARLFQVDMTKPAQATLSTRLVADVAKALQQLARTAVRSTTFDDWKRAFRERWEDRLVPLAEVLDEESGIGFESARGPGSEAAPLLAGLPFRDGRAENRVRWGSSEQHMLQKLTRALARGDSEIVLDDADLDAMKVSEPASLPEAFSATIRVAGTSDDDATILFEGSNGPSGARLLGRFCHASPEIEEIVRAHHALEESLRPDAVFAEIVHLNEGRIGNILCRPVLREHEIVYLGVSGATGEQQLTIEDLLVSVRGGRIALWSNRLGREVVPRLTTAHNFRLRSLCVYRFLCALAGQGTGAVFWSWGPLGAAPHLPRVRFGRVVLARAMWNLDARDLAPITSATRAANKDPAARPAVLDAVAALRHARALPRMFAIQVADNELPIDLDNPLLAAAFADEVSGTQQATLVELFPAADRLVVHGPEGAFSHEIVLTFTKQPERDVAPPRPVEARPSIPTIRREFPPGSEWLFAKIYCGEATADRVLREVVGPVSRAALAGGDARYWYFIRYSDPDPHVRVRFAGEPARLLGAVLPALERALAPLCASGAVRKLVLDTYVREVERYGGDRGIELVEQIFWRDSEAVLEIVELLEGDAGAVARWKLAVRGIDSLLESVGLTPEQRAQIMASARENLGREMSVDTPLWTKIGERFTRERAELDVMFERDPTRDAAHDYEPGFAALARRDAAIRALAVELKQRDAAGELRPRLAEFAWSLVHMHANRLLHASQRAQEMILYDFLRRLHASVRARGAAKAGRSS